MLRRTLSLSSVQICSDNKIKFKIYVRFFNGVEMDNFVVFNDFIKLFLLG